MKIKSIAIVATLALTLAATTTSAQDAKPTVGAGISDVFDLNNTNSLVNANEINLSVGPKWNSATEEAGGVLSVDWWVTDQQGAFFSFEEYSSRQSFSSVGYQARTVFKGLEVSLGVGARQADNDPFGDVEMFLRPTFTKQIFANEKWDLRIAAGCDMLNEGKPNPFLLITVRALRF